MNNLINEGDEIKVFLRSNNIVFSGTVVAIQDSFLKMSDSKTKTTRVIQLNEVSNLELLNQHGTQKKSESL